MPTIRTRIEALERFSEPESAVAFVVLRPGETEAEAVARADAEGRILFLVVGVEPKPLH